MNGILLVDKPAGWTSHDVVAKLRGVLGERRMGHSGTLDPMATGLLVVFAGRATRAVSFSENHTKCYEAHLRLGLTTDTQDTTGTVLSRSERAVSRAELEAVLPQFRGDILQVPPMYSALKVDGKKLYEIARRGGEVARKARPVTIEELTVLGEADGDYALRVRCSKGTYIRTLCHDIGAALGCGGVMSALRRTEVGAYRVSDAHTMDALCALPREAAQRLLLSVDSRWPMLRSAPSMRRRSGLPAAATRFGFARRTASIAFMLRRGSFSCWRRSRTAQPSRSKVFSRFRNVWKTRNVSLLWAFLTASTSVTPRSCAARSRVPRRWALSPR